VPFNASSKPLMLLYCRLQSERLFVAFFNLHALMVLLA
jgi:hypothetical protein